jgi:hypothetical protein
MDRVQEAAVAFWNRSYSAIRPAIGRGTGEARWVSNVLDTCPLHGA